MKDWPEIEMPEIVCIESIDVLDEWKTNIRRQYNHVIKCTKILLPKNQVSSSATQNGNLPLFHPSNNRLVAINPKFILRGLMHSIKTNKNAVIHAAGIKQNNLLSNC